MKFLFSLALIIGGIITSALATIISALGGSAISDQQRSDHEDHPPR